jgi:FdhD protein
MAGLDIKGSMLLVSGRISSEIVLKAGNLGIPMIISISAPTNMAVELARKMSMTLIGFARGDSFNVYAGESQFL